MTTCYFCSHDRDHLVKCSKCDHDFCDTCVWETPEGKLCTGCIGFSDKLYDYIFRELFYKNVDPKSLSGKSKVINVPKYQLDILDTPVKNQKIYDLKRELNRNRKQMNKIIKKLLKLL